MREINLDATNWVTVHDFYDALLSVLGAPDEHGRNINALIDSMVWGGINKIDPPYSIHIRGIGKLPKEVRDHIELAKNSLLEARAQNDADVQFETVP
jgi:RNAse (barnase) inhibitor barstar